LKAKTGRLSTVNVTCAKSPVLPVTFTVGLLPAVAPAPTLKEAVTFPALTEHVGDVISNASLDVSWQLTSVVLKPVPVTDTDVSAGPSGGVTMIVGVKAFDTCSTAVAESPPLLDSLIK
jgi:hypothetical protein